MKDGADMAELNEVVHSKVIPEVNKVMKIHMQLCNMCKMIQTYVIQTFIHLHTYLVICKSSNVKMFYSKSNSYTNQLILPQDTYCIYVVTTASAILKLQKASFKSYLFWLL